MTVRFLPPVEHIWFHLRWPHEVTPEQLLAALLSLNGSSTPRRADALVVRASGRAGQVTHHLAVPEPRASGVRRQLEAAIPGLAVEPVDEQTAEPMDRTWRGWFSNSMRPLELKESEAIARGTLTALASAGSDEQLVLQWVLGPVRRPLAVGSRVPGTVGPGAGKVLADLLNGPAELDGEARTALSHKQGLPGWRAIVHLGVRAEGRRRQLQLLGRLAAAIRVAQGSGVQVGFRSARPVVLDTNRVPFRRPLLVNVGELKGLIGWPLGTTELLPVERIPSRLLPPAIRVPSTGRIVGEATYPGRERPLALTYRDALQHLHVIGPTGVGKSTLLLNLMVQDMAAGRSLVLIEPKGDLVHDVLARVPDDRLDDVVVIDPADSAPVGINPLAAPGVEGGVKTDQLLAIFKGLFPESWGPRLQDILTAGLLTLTRTPGMSLPALPLLFTDAAFRRRLLGRVHDPLALGPFWSWFEELSVAERALVLAPVMNRLRAFLLRDRLRRVLGQTRPRFDLRQVFRERKILLVNANAGALGSESASLLGSLVVSQLWQTALGRSRAAPEQRHPVMVVIDEFQNYLHLPTDLADVLAQARGLGVGLTLAHQHLGQLPLDVKAAVLANARSRVLFAANHEDARVLVKGDERLVPTDVVSLGRFEAYASLLADNQSTPYASTRTHPAPPAVGPARRVLARSREQWGVPAGVVDAELEALAHGVDHGRPAKRTTSDRDAFGVTKRTGKERRQRGEATS
jgi:hypothetical protein